MIGNPTVLHPTLLTGLGTIEFIGKVELGVALSPEFYAGYGYVDVRKKTSRVIIGDGVYINNGFSIICDETTIVIGDNTLIGMNCEILDSDFHSLHPDYRLNGKPKTAPVNIGKNVFIGNSVTILKGVTIGENTVIGAGSVVVSDIPENVVACGFPAKIIRHLEMILL